MKFNRKYRKSEPFNDPRQFFIIACEGAVREKAYFERFATMSAGLRFVVLSPQDSEDDSPNNSAPKWVLDRIVKFIEKEGVNIEKGDSIWLVLDIDRWGKALHDLQWYCENHGWNMALSNPCFEVWLWLHIKEISETNAESCQDFKYAIHQAYEGGYKVEVFTQKDYYETALIRSQLLDTVEGFMPNEKTTKVHLLLNALFERLK